MLSWMKKKILEHHNLGRADICKHCVWHKSEDLYGMPTKKHVSYCSLNKKYTAEYGTCSQFHEELFEATENSTQSKEYFLDKTVELENN